MLSDCIVLHHTKKKAKTKQTKQLIKKKSLSFPYLAIIIYVSKKITSLMIIHPVFPFCDLKCLERDHSAINVKCVFYLNITTYSTDKI